jgi:hypothetical protein
MYDYGRKEPEDATDENANAVIMYLSHNNKPEHVAAVMELVRRLASSEKRYSKLEREMAAMQEEKHRWRGEGEYPRTLELPPGTRKVNIEF